MVKELSLNEAFENEKDSLKSILIGNGFSISIENRFKYEYLLKVAEEKIPENKRISKTLVSLFKKIDTVDFEKTLNYLLIANKINEIYENDEINKVLGNDIESIRNAFIDSFLYVHPRNISSINLDYAQFISNFKNIFTTNYDLILYWVILEHFRSIKNDGFGYPGIPNTPWLSNPIWINADSQNVFYLHGGFHIYSSEFTYKEIAEYCEDEYNPLLNIIKNKIENNKFPLIVFEGNSDEKLTTINSSSYLTNAYNRLGKIEGTLFTFGSSLNEHSDKHIIDKIKLSKFKNIYIGYHENLAKYDSVIAEFHKNQKNVFLFKCSDIFDE